MIKDTFLSGARNTFLLIADIRVGQRDNLRISSLKVASVHVGRLEIASIKLTLAAFGFLSASLYKLSAAR